MLWMNVIAFGQYWVVALVLMGIFAWAYTKITPYHEWQLIKKGNLAAAVTFGGALLGFVQPLLAAIIHSVGIESMIAWAALSFAAQLMALVVVRIGLTNFVREIEWDNLPHAVVLAVCSYVVGAITAACMTP